jgi:RNA polymerase sigma-70 factor (ECF subfamily)
MSGSHSDGSPGSVTNWLRRHDDEAARRIWERYVRRLLTLARQDLERAVQARLGAEDVVQSAFRSYFRRRADYDLMERDELWSLLVTITLNKVRNANRHHRRKKRDVRRTRSDREGNALGSGGCMFDLLSDKAPTPEEVAALAEELEQRLHDLEAAGDPDLPRIAGLKLDGYSNGEIAEALGLTERSIERKLGRIRRRWDEGGWLTVPCLLVHRRGPPCPRRSS